MTMYTTLETPRGILHDVKVFTTFEKMIDEGYSYAFSFREDDCIYRLYNKPNGISEHGIKWALILSPTND